MNGNTIITEQHPQSEDMPRTNGTEQPNQSHGINTLPIVDPIFVEDDVPEEIVQPIAAHLLQPEAIFALFRVQVFYSTNNDPEHAEKVSLWIIVASARLLLLAVSSEGQTSWEAFDQQTPVEYQDGLARDEVRIGDKSILTGLWEGKRKLFKEALRLFALPEYEKYLALAEIYFKKEAYDHAIPLLQKSLELVPTIKGHLFLVYSLYRVGTPEKALEAIQHVYQLAEPAAVLQELQAVFPENLVMLLYHAVACEKNRWWDEGIEVYHRLLEKTPDFDLYFLKLGEMYHGKQAYQTAVEYYQKFLALRTESEKFASGEFINWDLSDCRYFAADPDFTKALFDLGRIQEESLHDEQEALTLYLALLRHAPFYVEAYKHLWRVYQRLLDSPDNLLRTQPLHANVFWQVYNLLAPAEYAALVSSTSGFPEKPPLTAYRKLSEAEHQTLTHPGEQEYWQRIQHWITTLVVSEDDDQGIEQYCDQVTASNYPDIFQTIERIASCLNIPAPRCFISHGKIGVSVKNKKRPFIFIGSEHLTEGNERYLSDAELRFIMAAQAEHIKSGHLLITGTELWKSFGAASFDGFLVVLQYLPAGSFLGKVTHRFATEGLKRIYKMTKYSTVQRILRFFGKNTADQATAGASERDEDETAGTKTLKSSEPDSLLKEQIVNFARYAIYTADRVGLLACDDLRIACAAIFKLAANTAEDLGKIHQEGMLKVLEKRDKGGNCIYFEYAKRFNELMKFAYSEEYWRLHENIVIASGERPEGSSESPQDTAEYKNLIDKLRLLEQSRQKDLLTAEEFFLKQHQLLTDSGCLGEDDASVIAKYQQACREHVLTHTELQTKIFQLLETRGKER